MDSSTEKKRRGRKAKIETVNVVIDPEINTIVEEKIPKKRGRKPKGGKRRVTSESDWKKYYGSNQYLKEDVKTHGAEHFTRKILSLHKTVGKTNFAETEALFKYKVLTEKLDNGTPMYYNDNILGRYFKKHYWED